MFLNKKNLQVSWTHPQTIPVIHTPAVGVFAQIAKLSTIMQKRKIKLETVSPESNQSTTVVARDVPGHGNAYHKYQIFTVLDKNELLARIDFQDGPVKENGVNGCTNEDLLHIVLHRLKSFQSGEFKCYENELAITMLEETLFNLDKRTARRESRGVEGTSAK